jgi:hypothetical protein
MPSSLCLLHSLPCGAWCCPHTSLAFGHWQSLPLSTVFTGQVATMSTCGLFLPFTPTIDGVEFSEHPTLLASQGRFSNPVPVLLGSNENEGVTFIPLATNATQGDMVAAVSAMFGAAAVPTILSAYPVRGCWSGRGGGGILMLGRAASLSPQV